MFELKLQVITPVRSAHQPHCGGRSFHRAWAPRRVGHRHPHAQCLKPGLPPERAGLRAGLRVEAEAAPAQSWQLFVSEKQKHPNKPAAATAKFRLTSQQHNTGCFHIALTQLDVPTQRALPRVSCSLQTKHETCFPEAKTKRNSITTFFSLWHELSNSIFFQR